MIATRMRDGANDGEVVRDEHIGDAFFALQADQQVEDLAAHRDVERRHRFVEHDQVGPGGDGAGDGDALALAAGDLADAACRPASDRGRRAPADARSAAGRSAAVCHAVDAQRIGERAADGGARIEGGQRILEHHLDAPRWLPAALRRAAPAGRRRRSRCARHPARSGAAGRARASTCRCPRARPDRASRPGSSVIDTSSSATTRRPPLDIGLRDAGRRRAAARSLRRPPRSAAASSRSIWLAISDAV